MSAGDVPTVYCVVPVHNRAPLTRRCLEYLRDQDYPRVRIFVVDDGSTDDTSVVLAQHCGPDLTVVRGDGTLWWGGAMRAGMKSVSISATDRDYLLMLNNDVRIERSYISSLVAESKHHGNAVVGSAQRDESTGTPIPTGVRVNFWSMQFVPVESGIVEAVPGRGVLFPYSAIRQIGQLRSGLFPHYVGDLEYTYRAHCRGIRVVTSARALLITSGVTSDQQIRYKGWMARRFSWRSKDCVVQKVLFFSMYGPWPLRILALPRLALIGGFRSLSKLCERAITDDSQL